MTCIPLSRLLRVLVVAVVPGLTVCPPLMAKPTRQQIAEAPTKALPSLREDRTSPVPPTVKPPCSLARKKLWSEREGWIVRRVSSCN